MTQDELAEHSGLSSVGMLESGARPNAREGTLSKIAEALSARLGRKITPADLRAGPRPGLSANALRALDELLASPLGADITTEEQAELRSLEWPAGKQPTAKSWSFMLDALRSTTKGEQ